MTRLIIINLLLSLILFSGCGDVDTADSEGLQIRMAAASSCTSHGNSDNSKDLPLGASSFVVRLTGGEEEFVRRVEEREDGIYVIPGIEPATDMKLEVVACNGASASWAGVTTGVDVEEHEKTFPAIFLTPIGGQPACVEQNKIATSRPFASGVRIDDDVYVLGGVVQYALAVSMGKGVGKGVAGRDVFTYGRLSGENALLPASADLLEVRAMAVAYVTADNKIRLIGGASKVHINAAKFDLWTPGGSAPACGVETYDPVTGTSTCTIEGALPAGGSGVYLGDDVAVYVGGVEEGGDDGVISDKLYVIKGDAKTEFPLPQPRFGATVIRLSSTHALVWGGNTEGGTDSVGLVVDTSSLTQSLDVITELATTGLVSSVPIWAAGVYAMDTDGGGYAALIAGGTDLTGTGSDAGAGIPPSGPRLDLVTIAGTPGGMTVEVEAVSLGEDAPLFKRAGAQLLAVGSDEFWLVGGITSFVPDAEVCPGQMSGGCLPSSTARFSVSKSSAGVGITSSSNTVGDLTIGPLGAIAVDLGDESFLVVGGAINTDNDAVTLRKCKDGSKDCSEEAADYALAAELVRYQSSASGLCGDTTIPSI